MKDIQFSPLQKEIVENTQGAMAVIASAGSGKTRVLTGRINYLLQNVPGAYWILALTFTNKAADEMKTRLSSIPNIDDRVFIGTIHSFCLSVLREKGHAIGYQEMPHIFEKESDRLEVIAEVFKRNESLTNFYAQKDERDKRKLLYEALDYISTRKRNLQLSNIESESELLILYNDYNRFLAEQNAIDYDDIILLAYRIFIEKLKVAELYRKLYQYICVDEAQDLNFAQYNFIKILCGVSHANVLMVGDDKQAIFGFNGSDKKYFSELFVKDFNANIIQLTENYRSSKAIIRVANLIYANSIDEVNVVYEGKTTCYRADDENNEADYVINKIQYYLNSIKQEESKQIEGSISLEKICIIARNKYIFNTLQEKLKSNQLPFYYKKGSDTILFESDEMRIFELGIRVLLNPLDKLHLIQIQTLLNIGNNIPDMDSLKKHMKNRNNPIYNGIVFSWEVIENDNKSFRESLDKIQTSFTKTNEQGEENHLELIFDEIDSAKNHWKKYCSSVAPDSISIQGFFSNIALGMVNVINKKETGLTLGTVHSVKGLEYDIVFVIGLNEGGFPDYRAVKAGGKQMEEEKNLTYVALTRAKRFLHLSYPQKKFMPWNQENPYPQTVSRFLKDVFNERVR